MSSNFWRVWLRTLAVAAALVGIASAELTAQGSTSERPSISAVHVGIANQFKVGHWTPVTIDATGLGALEDPRIQVTVVDSDGVATTATAAFTESSTTESMRTIIVYTRVGRMGAPIRVVLADGDKQVAEQAVLTTSVAQSTSAPIELPPTGELLVALSSASFGLQRAFPDRDAAENMPARRTVELSDVTNLPVHWFGYDAVDVLVLSAGDGTICSELAADKARFAALLRWVELGGKLVILCGGESAEKMLAEGGALAPLLPGKLVDVVGLTDLGRLEHFAEPAAAIPVSGRGAALRVPRISNVRGHIELYEGRQPSDLPLVVRAGRGLGEITFAGIDLEKPPLVDWADRHMLLQALLRPYVAANESLDESQTLVARGYNDLSGALRQKLGGWFASLVPIGFSLVAGLAILYLLVLGPIDYLFVQRWLRQPLAAWVTFPVIVLLVGSGALGLAEWRRGKSAPRVNRLELVDVDATTGQARGTFWATLFSPRAARFDLGLQLAAAIDSQPGEQPETLISWWGLPGTGVGGMQARGTDLEVVREGYRYASDLEALEGVPVLTSSTKSLVARWTASVEVRVESQLTDQDDFATGSITNRTGNLLRNARLLYGGWGYWLGNLKDGQQIEVGAELVPRRVKTIVTSSALGRTAAGTGPQEGTVFSAERASALELLNLMMFFDAAGGVNFAKLPSRVHADCDLSGFLQPGMGRAILVAEVAGPSSRLKDTDRDELLGDEDDFSAVVYRFVLPITDSVSER